MGPQAFLIYISQFECKEFTDICFFATKNSPKRRCPPMSGRPGPQEVYHDSPSRLYVIAISLDYIRTETLMKAELRPIHAVKISLLLTVTPHWLRLIPYLSRNVFSRHITITCSLRQILDKLRRMSSSSTCECDAVSQDGSLLCPCNTTARIAIPFTIQIHSCE